MTESAPLRLVTTWFGAFLYEGEQLREARPFPHDPAALAERLALRREGRRTPEEEELLAEVRGRPYRTRDQRLIEMDVRPALEGEPAPDPDEFGFAPTTLRELLLARAERDLTERWDPSVHVREAVRGLSDLDDALNTVGERLLSWGSEDRGSGRYADLGPRKLAEALASPAPPEPEAPLPADPPLAEARRQLAATYLSLAEARAALEHALTEAMPRRAPNLTALLGPLLAARMIGQAGSLERLAELPASTIQVLGAEKAFFEHLRGRAPPPRHGLLFLHPRLHSAPRTQRGRLARALAGKVAIAARLDRAGRPVDPSLATGFEARAERIRAAPAGRSRSKRLRTPLHRAAEDG